MSTFELAWTLKKLSFWRVIFPLLSWKHLLYCVLLLSKKNKIFSIKTLSQTNQMKLLTNSLQICKSVTNLYFLQLLLINQDFFIYLFLWILCMTIRCLYLFVSCINITSLYYSHASGILPPPLLFLSTSFMSLGVRSNPKMGGAHIGKKGNRRKLRLCNSQFFHGARAPGSFVHKDILFFEWQRLLFFNERSLLS